MCVSGEDEGSVDQTARELGRKAPNDQPVLIMGPAPAPLAILRGRHRRRFLLKFPKAKAVQSFVRQWLDQVNVPSTVKIQIDVDPGSFM